VVAIYISNIHTRHMGLALKKPGIRKSKYFHLFEVIQIPELLYFPLDPYSIHHGYNKDVRMTGTSNRQRDIHNEGTKGGKHGNTNSCVSEDEASRHDSGSNTESMEYPDSPEGGSSDLDPSHPDYALLQREHLHAQRSEQTVFNLFATLTWIFKNSKNKSHLLMSHLHI
jgi:hypothetical protein